MYKKQSLIVTPYIDNWDEKRVVMIEWVTEPIYQNKDKETAIKMGEKFANEMRCDLYVYNETWRLESKTMSLKKNFLFK